MAIRVKCPGCGGKATAPNEAIGKKGRCGSCHVRFIISRLEGPSVGVDGKQIKPAARDPRGGRARTLFCTACGKATSEEAAARVGSSRAVVPLGRGNRAGESTDNGRWLLAAGYLCPCLALVLWPPIFGIAGLVIGIIHLTRGRRRFVHGVAQIVLSILFTFIAMAVGIAVMDWASRSESDRRLFGIAGLVIGIIHLTRGRR
jgi:hypothetical protein